VNKQYRITSDSSCWTVQRYTGKRKDGKEDWDSLYHCADFRNALVALAELQMRLIDSSVPKEIKTAIRKIRDECVTAAKVFRELAT
jgi:hypothetical protein